MNGWSPWLAQLNPAGDGGLGPPSPSKATNLLTNDVAIIFLVGICLTLIFTPLAIRIWRNPGRRTRRFKSLPGMPITASHPPQPKPIASPPPPPPAEPAARRRRRGRAHRPRNPTLAEIGGLPPLRPDADAPPTSS